MEESQQGAAPPAPANGPPVAGPTPADGPAAPAPAGAPTALAVPPGLPPGALIGMGGQPPPPRASLSSMLLMTTMFFLMSGGNGPNNAYNGMELNEQGEIVHRLSELDVERIRVDEWQAITNGSGIATNWTEPLPVRPDPVSLLPPHLLHTPSSFSLNEYPSNITGYYRDAVLHPLNLSEPSTSSSSTHFFRHIDQFHLSNGWDDVVTPYEPPQPRRNMTEDDGWAENPMPEWEWWNTQGWSLNMNERKIPAIAEDGTVLDDSKAEEEFRDWSWLRGSMTLSTGSNSSSVTSDYAFRGLHYKPNGTYVIVGMPSGLHLDIRTIPRLFPSEYHNVTSKIIMGKLKVKLKELDDSLLLNNAPTDDPYPKSHCPLIVHLRLPPLPAYYSAAELEQYEEELRNPTGILSSLRPPPNYWGDGFGGVMIAEGCGWALGIEGGSGIKLEPFWNESIKFTTFSTLVQFTILCLMVYQMEATRTPSSLAKVSLWTIVLMAMSDNMLFSMYFAMGAMSHDKTSLPFLLPAFLCMCSAIIFMPRYCGLLLRIRTSEQASAPLAPRPSPSPTPVPATDDGDAADTSATTPLVATTPSSQVPSTPFFTLSNPLFRKIGIFVVLFIYLTIAFNASLIAFFLPLLFSFWVPQIWRNARRGTSRGLKWKFILGSSTARVALPLYVYAYPNNIFFTETSDWVWLLVAWVWFQVLVLVAQDRFGPAFFLPRSMAPEDAYNYHQLIPMPDPENPSQPQDFGTCSICMEEVVVHPPALSAATTPEGALVGLNARRAYALAPCHHLFHTDCLSQWMAVKNICPLCKRSLPPL